MVKIKRFKAKAAAVMTAAAVFLMSGTSVFASAISSNVDNASNAFVELLQSLGKPLVMAIIAAMGLFTVIATQHQRESIKEGILPKLIGVGLVVLAVPAADAIWGIF